MLFVWEISVKLSVIISPLCPFLKDPLRLNYFLYFLYYRDITIQLCKNSALTLATVLQRLEKVVYPAIWWNCEFFCVWYFSCFYLPTTSYWKCVEIFCRSCMNFYEQYDPSGVTFKPPIPPPRRNPKEKRLKLTHDSDFVQHCHSILNDVPNSVECWIINVLIGFLGEFFLFRTFGIVLSKRQSVLGHELLHFMTALRSAPEFACTSWINAWENW